MLLKNGKFSSEQGAGEETMIRRNKIAPENIPQCVTTFF